MQAVERRLKMLKVEDTIASDIENFIRDISRNTVTEMGHILFNNVACHVHDAHAVAHMRLHKYSTHAHLRMLITQMQLI